MVGRQLVRSQVCVSWQGYKERRAANSSKSLGCAAACLALARDPPVVSGAPPTPRSRGTGKAPPRQEAAGSEPVRGLLGRASLLHFVTSPGFRQGRLAFPFQMVTLRGLRER